MEIVQKGILFGIFAGILDIFFLLFQRLTLELSVSLFLTCVVCGLFIATTNSSVRGAWRGFGISLLLLAPQFFFIAQQSGIQMIPPFVATVLFCTLTGHIVVEEKEKEVFIKEKRKPATGLFKESKIGIFKD